MNTRIAKATKPSVDCQCSHALRGSNHLCWDEVTPRGHYCRPEHQAQDYRLKASKLNLQLQPMQRVSIPWTVSKLLTQSRVSSCHATIDTPSSRTFSQTLSAPSANTKKAGKKKTNTDKPTGKGDTGCLLRCALLHIRHRVYEPQ